jgi:hypothetical protein
MYHQRRLHLFLPTERLQLALPSWLRCAPTTAAAATSQRPLEQALGSGGGAASSSPGDAPTPTGLPTAAATATAAALCAMNLLFMCVAHGGRLDSAGSLFLLGVLYYGRAVLPASSGGASGAGANLSQEPPPPPGGARARDTDGDGGLVRWLCALAFLYGYVGPVAGVQSMASSTMYGNTLQYGRGNHFLVPTFALQRRYAQRSPAGAHCAAPLVPRRPQRR